MNVIRRDVPTKFRTMAFEHSVMFGLPLEARTQLRDYVDKFERIHLPAGRGLWLSGESGVGKTAAACAVLLTIAPRRRAGSCAFWPFRRLLNRIRDTFRQDAEERASELLAAFSDIELLVLDDLGAVHDTPWARATLTDIVIERDELVRPTIFTTDLSDAALGNTFNHRVVRRMQENSVRVHIEHAHPVADESADG